MIVCIQSPSRILLMQDQQWLTGCWLSCSGWGRDRVSVVFGYKGGWFIRNGHWLTKVNILWLAVGYPNVTLNSKSRNTEQEVETEGSSQTRHNPQIDRYGSRFGPRWRSRSGFWTVLEPNGTSILIRTRTAGGLPGPVANTTHSTLSTQKTPTSFLHNGAPYLSSLPRH